MSRTLPKDESSYDGNLCPARFKRMCSSACVHPPGLNIRFHRGFGFSASDSGFRDFGYRVEDHVIEGL